MVCSKCRANVASDANFCPRCGTPFRIRSGFVANLWRENKPGFLVLSLLLVAMLGSIGYYLYSRTGKFVVTVKTVGIEEAVDLYTNATLEVYCREFAADCQEGKANAVKSEIKKVIPAPFRDNAGGYALISYYNGRVNPSPLPVSSIGNHRDRGDREIQETIINPRSTGFEQCYFGVAISLSNTR